MNENGPFTHEERPPYQRENIDLALKIGLGIMSELGIDNSDYNPEKIRFVDSMGDFGGIHKGSNKIEIDERFRFNQSVYLHEILHGLSTSYPIKKSGKLTFRSGYQKHGGANSGFNEGFTDILTLYGIQNNLEEVKVLRKKFRELMHKHHDLARESGDPEFNSYIYGCKNTGWYRAYFREMRLVDSIIDLVAYKRYNTQGGDLEGHQEDIFEDLIFSYFTGDLKILYSILKEADPSGSLKAKIKIIEPGDIEGKNITDGIRKRISDTFNPNYRMSPIPQKLD